MGDRERYSDRFRSAGGEADVRRIRTDQVGNRGASLLNHYGRSFTEDMVHTIGVAECVRHGVQNGSGNPRIDWCRGVMVEVNGSGIRARWREIVLYPSSFNRTCSSIHYRCKRSVASWIGLSNPDLDGAPQSQQPSDELVQADAFGTTPKHLRQGRLVGLEEPRGLDLVELAGLHRCGDRCD